jgi:cell division protein FtsQ
MEKLLETNIWVRDARVYFDNKDVLHVKLTQRQPMARVFTSGGRSFYLDESGQILHLVDQLKLSLPVFTGFPERKQLSSSDSLLVKDMISLASFLQEESFWDAQIGQVNLVSSGPKDWEFELVPLIGSHLIRLGNAESMEQKFNRLYQFYRQVIPKAGWEKYKVVDIRFAGQVVAEKK